MRIAGWLGLIVGVAAIGFASDAWAQLGQRQPRDRMTGRPLARSAYVSPQARGARNSFASRSVGGARLSRNASRPFANIRHRPTVSPFVNLARSDLDFELGVPTYQSTVRPQLDQIDFNQRQSFEMQQINEQIRQIEARTAFQPQGSTTIRPTGHVSYFFNYSTYFGGAR